MFFQVNSHDGVIDVLWYKCLETQNSIGKRVQCTESDSCQCCTAIEKRK